jgi:hypothetical protein
MPVEYRVSKYAYNPPWRLIILGILCYSGLAAIIWHKSQSYHGLWAVVSRILGGLFAALAVYAPVRRMVVFRELVLTEHEILFPRGWFRSKTRELRYDDVIEINESVSSKDNSSMEIIGGGTRWSINELWLGSLTSYAEIRDFVCSKTGIELSSSPWKQFAQNPSWRRRRAPDPLLTWLEPQEWEKYKTNAFHSKPILKRLRELSFFFLKWFLFIAIPWLVIKVIYPTPPLTEFDSSAVCYLSGDLLLSLLFASICWLNAATPHASPNISFFKHGAKIQYPKQDFQRNWSQILKWSISKVEFEGRELWVLNLQCASPKNKSYVYPLALPDSSTLDAAAAILRDKGIPEVDGLKSLWESNAT